MTENGQTNCFQISKGVKQDYMLASYFSTYFLFINDQAFVRNGPYAVGYSDHESGRPEGSYKERNRKTEKMELQFSFANDLPQRLPT